MTGHNEQVHRTVEKLHGILNQQFEAVDIVPNPAGQDLLITKCQQFYCNPIMQKMFKLNFKSVYVDVGKCFEKSFSN